MNRRARLLVVIAFIVLEVLLVGAVMAQEPISPQAQLATTFTYQGQLKKNGAPITASGSMIFRLYDQANSGNAIHERVRNSVRG